MGQNGHPRGNLESQGNYKKAKSISRGFGIVRLLTNASQRNIYNLLSEANIAQATLRRKPSLHATVIGFVGMSKREQATFQAGFNVARLEQKLEDGVHDECPRVALPVKLGSVKLLGNLIYSEIEHAQLDLEQVRLAGQVALSGISPQRIDNRSVRPHMTVGYAQEGSAEDLRDRVETLLFGQTIALQRWNVYPDRYA